MTELIAYASGIAANDSGCGEGPLYLKAHPEFLPANTHFNKIIHPNLSGRGLNVLADVVRMNTELALATQTLTKSRVPFCVLGGDHSCGIGTWSGVADAKKSEGDIGLIWIDAHEDSHVPETSPTQNIHGMPISHLLGEGIQELTSLLGFAPKIKPANIVLIGIRSFEDGEDALLKRLGVKIYKMGEVQAQGIDTILRHALTMVSKNTVGFGLSIDLDAFDPQDAPGVGCREAGGIMAKDLLAALQKILRGHPNFLGLEIAEFNPSHDADNKTAKLIGDIIQAVY